MKVDYSVKALEERRRAILNRGKCGETQGIVRKLTRIINKKKAGVNVSY